MKKSCFLMSVCMLLVLGMTAHGAELPDASREGVTREAEGDTLTKTVILPAGGITPIPRYEIDGNILYILDEDSLSLRTVSTDSAEGADMITVTKIITGLPDNDLERIPMTEKQDGINCDLLYVSYKVTEESKEGMPLKYEALCWYGGLSKYKVDYDAAWEAVMTYTGHPIESGIHSTAVEYIYRYENLPGAIEGGGGESKAAVPQRQGEPLRDTKREEETEAAEEGAAPVTAEEEQKPEQEQERESEPGQDPSDNRYIGDEDTPLGAPEGTAAAAAAALAAGGLLAAALLYVYFHTAPIYAAVYSGGYKRIGRIRLKRRKDHYAAVLSEYLIEKAEIGKYKIKVSRYIRNRSRAGILDIQCPDGRTITRKLKEVVLFTVNPHAPH